jgi:hypothetical protein
MTTRLASTCPCSKKKTISRVICGTQYEKWGHVSTFHTTLLTVLKGGTDYTAGGVVTESRERRAVREMARCGMAEQSLEDNQKCRMWNVKM